MNDEINTYQRRYEIKSVMHNLMVDDFLFKLNFFFNEIKKSYDDRIINNLYFDNNSYSLVEHHINGAELRKKIRVRWYGDNPIGTPGELQIKWKRNYFNWKKNYTLSKNFYFNGSSWMFYKKKIMGMLPIEAKTILKLYPRPTVLNKYLRKYFETDDKQIRVTVDQQITNWSQLSIFKPNLKNYTKLDELSVIEVKIPEDMYSFAATKLEKLNLYQRRHSKYLKGLYSQFPS